MDPKVFIILFRLVLTIPYLLLCYSTANYHAKKRKIGDVFLATLLCVFLTPLLGGLILVWFPLRKQEPKPEIKKILPTPKVLPPLNKKPKYNFTWRPRIKISKQLIRVCLIAFVSLIALLMLTNPSYKDFEEFTPKHVTKREYALRTRVHNYLVYSVYEITSYKMGEYDNPGEYSETYTNRYIGFFMNFY